MKKDYLTKEEMIRLLEAMCESLRGRGERLHGVWLESGSAYGIYDFVCSNCNSEFEDIGTNDGKPIYKFCPICGAEMSAE